jgi:hypothetical protein
LAESSSRLELYLKNLGLFDVEPAVSIYLDLSSGFSQKQIRELFTLFETWAVNRVFLFGAMNNQSTAQAFLEISRQHSTPLFQKKHLSPGPEIVIQFETNPTRFFSAHRELVNSDLLPQFFCSSEFSTSGDAWGQPVFIVPLQNPEVYEVNIQNGTIRFQPSNAKSIEALFLGPSPVPGDQTVEVTAGFDRKKGLIRLDQKSSGQAWLHVLRAARVSAGQTLQFYLNYGNLQTLGSLVDDFYSALEKMHIENPAVFYDLNMLIPDLSGQPLLPMPADTGILSTAQFNGNLKLEILKFLIDHDNHRAAKTVLDVFTGFLNERFEPAIHKKDIPTYYFLNIGHRFLHDSVFVRHSVLKINELRYYPGTSYFTHTNLHLRQAARHNLSSESGQVCVALHQLFNTRRSFSEKKYQFDHLIMRGASHFFFGIENELIETESDLLSQLPEVDPNFPVYHEWLAYLHQVSHFLKKSHPAPPFLILEADSHEENTEYFASIRFLDSQGYDFFLIQDRQFLDDAYCAIEESQISIKVMRFRILIIAGKKLLTHDVLQRVYEFYEAGGIIITLRYIPEVEQFKNRTIRQYHNELWFSSPRPTGISFKQSKKMGISYFCPDFNEFTTLQEQLSSVIQFSIADKPAAAALHMQEDHKLFYAFVFNPDAHRPVRMNLRGSRAGRPFLWDFSKAESVEYLDYYLDGQQLDLRINLEPAELKLFVIDKHSQPPVWQIRRSSLDGVDLMTANENHLTLEGWQRESGPFTLELATKNEIRQISYEIKEKLPVLNIRPQNWFAESADFQGQVNLGDFSLYDKIPRSPVIFHKVIIIPRAYIEQRLFLDIGLVKDWCSVFINDQLVTKKLYAPWYVDTKDLLKSGENKISIKVNTSLSNLLSGRRPERYTVREFGLWGPVRLIPFSKVKISI